MPKIEKVEAPTIKGMHAFFVLTLNIDPEGGHPKVAYNYEQGTNLERVGEALIEFGSHLKGGNAPQA